MRASDSPFSIMLFTNRFSFRFIQSMILGLMLIGLLAIPLPGFSNPGDNHSGTHSEKQGAEQNPAYHLHTPPEVMQLVEMIQKGGYTIFFRHERTGMTEIIRDRLPYDFANCDGQRMLSPAGIASSREVGQAFRLLNIPIEQVLSSPICRSKDSAKLAFQEFKVTNQLMVQNQALKRTKDDVAQDLTALVNQPHSPNQNVILIGHLGNMLPITLLPSEGEAIVLKPDGKGGVAVVGRIIAAHWGDVVRDLKRAKQPVP
jgi:phosphohistidine phosphatase SixA